MSTDQLAARLERLERSHASMKCPATVLGLLLAATFAGAMNEGEVPEVIRAKRFEVIGRSGAVGAFCAYPIANGAALTMLNADRKRVVALQTHDEGGQKTRMRECRIKLVSSRRRSARSRRGGSR